MLYVGWMEAGAGAPAFFNHISKIAYEKINIQIEYKIYHFNNYKILCGLYMYDILYMERFF